LIFFFSILIVGNSLHWDIYSPFLWCSNVVAVIVAVAVAVAVAVEEEPVDQPNHHHNVSAQYATAPTEELVSVAIAL
jgi:hypothetical protein